MAVAGISIWAGIRLYYLKTKRMELIMCIAGDNACVE